MGPYLCHSAVCGKHSAVWPTAKLCARDNIARREKSQKAEAAPRDDIWRCR